MGLLEQSPQDLTAVWQLCWQLLGRAAADKRDPMQSIGLGTRGDPFPSVRTVILREVNAEQQRLTCYSDIRANKCREIEQHAEVSWHAWHPRRKMQLRIQAVATIHHEDELARNTWKRLGPSSRLNYSASVAPGTALLTGATFQDLYADYDKLGSIDTDRWQEHFAVIKTEVHQIEWLWLRREGHMRARVTRDADNKIVGSWVVP